MPERYREESGLLFLKNVKRYQKYSGQGGEEMIDMEETAKRIKAACDREGISVKEIQRRLNIGAFQSVYNWFSGKTLPSLDNFYELCKMLHVPMESLIVESESEKFGKTDAAHQLWPAVIVIEDIKKYQGRCQERIIQYALRIQKAVG